MKITLLQSGLAGILGVAGMQAGLAYDPDADFTIASNPSGVWSYGWLASPGSSFTLFNVGGSFVEGGSGKTVEYWKRDGSEPLLFHHGGAGDLVFATISIPDGMIDLHPGGGGELAAVRWTAPVAGEFSISGNFFAAQRIGASPTTSDVNVFHNGASLFQAVLNGNEIHIPYAVTATVASGDTIDFAVGWGENHDYNWDNTAFSARLELVPEPHGYVLAAGLGLAGFAAWRRRTGRGS